MVFETGRLPGCGNRLMRLRWRERRLGRWSRRIRRRCRLLISASRQCGLDVLRDASRRRRTSRLRDGSGTLLQSGCGQWKREHDQRNTHKSSSTSRQEAMRYTRI